jgi:hypothetical protein
VSVELAELLSADFFDVAATGAGSFITFTFGITGDVSCPVLS